MSQTDDTDDLLLIPPDFFVVKESDNVINQPFFEIVDSLITQVSNLEDRVGLIEDFSDISLLSRNSFDRSFESADTMQNTSSSFRRFHSSDDLLRSPKGGVPGSTQSTPLKPRTKFKLDSVSVTPKTDRYSPKRSQSHGKGDRISQTQRYTQSQLFNQAKSTALSRSTEPVVAGNCAAERDSFISNVKTIKRLGAVRNLEHEFVPKNSNLNQTDIDGVGQMLKDMEVRQSEIESLIRAKEQEIYSKDVEPEPFVMAKKTWRLGDDINSVPDYNFGIRNLLYNEDSNNIKNPANLDLQNHSSTHGERIYKKDFLPNSESSKQPDYSQLKYTKNDKTVSDASSNSTQTTAINRNFFERENLDSHALDVINRHKRLLESEMEGKVKGKQSQQNQGSNRNFVNDDLGLVSLADLWNENRSNYDVEPNYKLKLQEEKLRRQHCEELIQQLQNRVLELQQRLAVAVQIDGTKDNAILHFHSAWEIMAQKLKTLASDKRQLEENYLKLKSTHETVMEEAQQKVSHYENEASKALNLAHGNQEKLSSLEKQCLELQNNSTAAETRLSYLQKLYDEEVEKNKQLAEVIAKKELELNRSKNALTDAKNEIAETNKAVNACQVDLSNMKTEYTVLEQTMKDKDNKILDLERQKRKINEDLDQHKSTIKNLQDELGKARDQIDNNRSELKHFYQGQVEIVVQNKLKEFQNQLDQAENGLRDELKKRELSIAKTAASHIQQITEKFSVEIKLLEEKHKEEIRLHQIKLTQYQQQIEDLERKFIQQQERRENIAQQLRKVMEAQWMEALRIISNNKSPIIQPENFSTIDQQLNSLKSRSYTNLEEVLSSIGQDHKAIGLENRNFKVGEYMSHSEEQESSRSRQMYKVPDETPVSSRGQHNKQCPDNDLQKYIQLLLNRQPGDANNMAEMNQSADSAKDRPSWQSSGWLDTNRSVELLQSSDAHNRQERQSGEQKSQRDKKGKRPWK